MRGGGSVGGDGVGGRDRDGKGLFVSLVVIYFLHLLFPPHPPPRSLPTPKPNYFCSIVFSIRHCPFLIHISSAKRKGERGRSKTPSPKKRKKSECNHSTHSHSKMSLKEENFFAFSIFFLRFHFSPLSLFFSPRRRRRFFSFPFFGEREEERKNTLLSFLLSRLF